MPGINCTSDPHTLSNAQVMYNGAVVSAANRARTNVTVTYECDDGYFVNHAGGGDGTITGVE